MEKTVSQVLSYNNYRHLVRDEVERRRLQDKRYSLRFFSKKMGVSETYLKQVVSGKRSLTTEKAFLLAQVFGFSVIERNFLITLCLRDRSRSRVLKQYFDSLIGNLQRQGISYSDQRSFTSVFSDSLAWEIYSLVGVDGFQIDPAWIVKKLNRPKLRLDQVQICVKRLLAIGAIAINGDGKFEASDAIIKHGRDVVSAYKASLNRSVKYLDEIGIDKHGYFDSFCLILNEDEYKNIMQILEDTKHRIATVAKQKQGKTMIAFFNSNLFPASNC